MYMQQHHLKASYQDISALIITRQVQKHVVGEKLKLVLYILLHKHIAKHVKTILEYIITVLTHSFNLVQIHKEIQIPLLQKKVAEYLMVDQAIPVAQKVLILAVITRELSMVDQAIPVAQKVLILAMLIVGQVLVNKQIRLYPLTIYFRIV